MSRENVLIRGDTDDKLDTVPLSFVVDILLGCATGPSPVAQRFSTATKETSGGVLATKPVLGDVGKIRGGQELLRDTEMSLKEKT